MYCFYTSEWVFGFCCSWGSSAKAANVFYPMMSWGYINGYNPDLWLCIVILWIIMNAWDNKGMSCSAGLVRISFIHYCRVQSYIFSKMMWWVMDVVQLKFNIILRVCISVPKCVSSTICRSALKYAASKTQQLFAYDNAQSVGKEHDYR